MKIKKTIVGIQLSIGEYEGRAYKNYNIFYTEPFDPSKGTGLRCDKVKCDVDVLGEICEDNELEIDNLVGVEVKDFYFDKYGKKVIGFRL